MIEVKTTDTDKPTMSYSWISDNERIALTEFERLVGTGHALIIGLWTRTEQRAFLIPWYQVRNAVCSGVRGSINMLEFPELKKVAGGWDMSCFKGKE